MSEKYVIPKIAQPTRILGTREGYPVEKGVAITEAFLERNKEMLGKYVDHWISYPDLLVDLLIPLDSSFRLYFFQRIFLRVALRYRYSFATFTRAFSKSFLSILALILRCILLPRSKVFLCADVLRQAVKIGKEKIDEIFHLFPLLEKEVMSYTKSTDYLTLTFYNGSVLDVVGVASSTRGGRRHAGLIEEAATIDGDELSSVVLPWHVKLGGLCA